MVQALASQAEQALQPDFGSVLAGLMSSCVAGYDEEAQYFDVVRRPHPRPSAKRVTEHRK